MPANADSSSRMHRLASSRALKLGLLAGGAVVWWMLGTGHDQAHADTPDAHPDRPAAAQQADPLGSLTTSVSGATKGLDKTVDHTVGYATKAVNHTVHATTNTVDRTVHATTKTVDHTVHAATKTVDTTVHATTKTIDTTVHAATKTVDRTVRATTGTVDTTVHDVSSTVHDTVTPPAQHETSPTDRGSSRARSNPAPVKAQPRAPAPARLAPTHSTVNTAKPHSNASAMPWFVDHAPPAGRHAAPPAPRAIGGHHAPAPSTPTPAPHEPAGAPTGTSSAGSAQHENLAAYATTRAVTHSSTFTLSFRRDAAWALLSRANRVKVWPG